MTYLGSSYRQVWVTICVSLRFLPSTATFSTQSTEKEHLIIYRINALEGIDSAKSLIVLLNGGPEAEQVEVPEGEYQLLAFNGEANVNGLSDLHEDHALVAPYSATILAEK